jgi:hypothetical protein
VIVEARDILLCIVSIVSRKHVVYGLSLKRCIPQVFAANLSTCSSITLVEVSRSDRRDHGEPSSSSSFTFNIIVFASTHIRRIINARDQCVAIET